MKLIIAIPYYRPQYDSCIIDIQADEQEMDWIGNDLDNCAGIGELLGERHELWRKPYGVYQVGINLCFPVEDDSPEYHVVSIKQLKIEGAD